MAFEEVEWMKSPCSRCDNTSERETRCGPLCTSCLNDYRAEYIEYKSISCYIVQKSLRQRFADKWFCGHMDDSHEWSLNQLTKTRVVPDFRQKSFDRNKYHTTRRSASRIITSG